TNAAVVPPKLKRHLTTKSQPQTSKGADYLKQILESQNEERKAFVGKVTVSERAQGSSCLVAELVVQKRESHTAGEKIIMTAEIENVPISNSTTNRRIDDMSRDAEEVLCKKRNNRFSIQVAESTDFTNKCYVVTSVRFTNGEIQGHLFCWRVMSETKKKYIFNVMSSYLEEKCVGSCKNNPDFTVYCFICREVLYKNHFPSLSTEVYGWVRNPHSDSSAQPENLTLREDEELCELQSDCTLKMRFTDISLDKFWISVKEECPAIHSHGINTHIATVFDSLHS
ncbi:hypothetical protein B7P43_G05335, partial [Cryptotermes secundus]